MKERDPQTTRKRAWESTCKALMNGKWLSTFQPFFVIVVVLTLTARFLLGKKVESVTR